METIRALLIGIVAISLAPDLSADALDNWEIRSPLPTSQAVQSVRFLNGEFVASAGEEGVFVSKDGIDWDRSAIPEDIAGGNFIFDVAYGAGEFVAVGGRGTILTSPD